MGKKIGTAADHGVDTFLFDWYWYGNKPYLHRALEEGFMQADNCHRLKFSLMWANHDWYNIHPAGLGRDQHIVFPGDINRDIWDNMTDYIITKYFQHPSYWLIDGKPVFQIYELFKLIAGLGGVDNCRRALSEFRDKTKAAGFDGLHLNAIIWGVQILPGEENCSNPAQMLKLLAFDSVTSYVWLHHIGLKQFPVTDYADVMELMVKMWPKLSDEYGLPYYPNVTMGWDSSPRTAQSDEFVDAGYPFCPGMVNNTPENFRKALLYAKDFIDSSSLEHKILTINAWNEWTEGSYLEPDIHNGLSYLEAIRDVYQNRSGSKILTQPKSTTTRNRQSLDSRRKNLNKRETSMRKSFFLTIWVLCFAFAMQAAADSFPVGWFDLVNQDLQPYNDPAELAAAGANYVTAYRLWPDYGSDIASYLSEASEEGLTVVLDIRYVVDNLNTAAGWEDILTDIAATYGDHPAVAGWLIAEKPYLYPQYSLLNCQTARNILNIYSTKPVYMVFDQNDMTAANPAGYSATYDVMMMEFAPASQGEAEFTGLSAWKSASLQARQQSSVLGKPLHNVIQALGDVSYMAWNYRLPTLCEERFMVYYSILTAHVDGVAFWAQNYLADSAATEDAYIYDGSQWMKDVGMPIGLELRSYARAIANGPIANGVNDGSANITSQVYQDPINRKYYLLSVNNEPTDTSSLSFTLNFPVSFEYAIPMAGNAPWIPISSSNFSDSFTAYQVNNYELLPAIRTCQDVIDEGCRIIGDLNGDCYVTVVDIAQLADSWLICNDPANDSCEH